MYVSACSAVHKDLSHFLQLQATNSLASVVAVGFALVLLWVHFLNLCFISIRWLWIRAACLHGSARSWNKGRTFWGNSISEWCIMKEPLWHVYFWHVKISFGWIYILLAFTISVPSLPAIMEENFLQGQPSMLETWKSMATGQRQD